MLSAAAALPFVLVAVFLMISMMNYSRTYDSIVRNMTTANNYNLNFKEEMDESLYKIVAVSYTHLSGIPVTSLAAGEAKAVEEGLIASFDFDSEEDGFIGAGAKAVVNGTAIFEDSYEGVGKALAVSESTWLSVYRDDDGAVLEGLESFTLSYDSKATNQKNGWAFYAAPDLNPQNGNGAKEHYLGTVSYTHLMQNI